MSVQRTQSEVTSSEYMDWIAYLDEEELNGFRREEYYLAAIAAEVRRSYVKDPEKVEVKSFLIKFKRGKETKKVEKTKEERIKASKTFWMALMGMGKGKRKK